MAKDYDYKGPGVTRPHPRKNWVNPDAHPVTKGGPGYAPPRQNPRQRPTPRPGPDPGLEPGPEAGPGPGGRGGGLGGRSPVQLFAGAVGLVFLLIGIAGFIPGVTDMYDDLAAFGTDSRAEVFGLFRVSILHNVVHLLFGVGLLAAARASWSRLYLLVGGVGYLAVAAYGFVIDEESDANFLPLNDADNLLHVGLSLLMIALALVGTAAERRRPASA